MTEIINETPIQKRSRMAAERVIRALENRRLAGYYAATKEEALELALSLIPKGVSVGWGGGVSMDEIGLRQAVIDGDYRQIDRDTAETPEERMALMRECLSAHTFLMGTNAITEDGQLVNLDGMGNRVAALCFGPEQVIVIAGMNKLVRDLDAAISRVRNVASPINAQRFPGDTPCRRQGVCGDCNQKGCICSQLVVTRNSSISNRIKVILVGENLGF